MANSYQDVNALLRTLSAYAPAASQSTSPDPSQSGQDHASQQQSAQHVAPAGDSMGTSYGVPGSYSDTYLRPSNAIASGDLYRSPPFVYPPPFNLSPASGFGLDQSSFGIIHSHSQVHTSTPLNDYGPSPCGLPQSFISNQLPPPQPVTHEPQPLEPPPTRESPPKAGKSPAPGPDPRSIVEWPAALRYVTKLAARSEELGNGIRKLIANQHDNERQWWAGRQALLEKQEARVEGKRKLDSVLRSVGAQVTGGDSVTDDAAELKLYDAKVYKASSKMVKAMTTDLETLGIPFFGTSPALVASKDAKPSYTGNDGMAADVEARVQPSRITAVELVKLQRRMIQHLQDLYVE